MDGLIFFLIFVFFIWPLLSRAFKKAVKSNPPPKASPWGDVQTDTRNRIETLNRQAALRQNTSHRSQIKPKLPNISALSGRNETAMKRVSNKSRSDWGTRGDRGLTSGKVIISVLLLGVIVYLILPELISAYF